MSCGNGNCSCGDDCKCGSGCKCGRTGLEFWENATTSKIIISGVAPLKTYYEEAEMNFGEVTAAGSKYSCESFGFHN